MTENGKFPIKTASIPPLPTRVAKKRVRRASMLQGGFENDWSDLAWLDYPCEG